MIKSYKKFWGNLFNFHGTATRSNYWWPIIINYLLSGIIVTIIQNILGHPIDDIYTLTDLNISWISELIIILVWIGMLSLMVRRMHDSDHSGFWVLIQFIPIIGTIWFFILTLFPSRRNRWDSRY